MNTPILSTELDPAEQKRRAAARARAEKLARRFGFRQVPAKPGWWWHEEIGQGVSFPFSVTGQVIVSTGDLIAVVFSNGMNRGRAESRTAVREALGL